MAPRLDLERPRGAGEILGAALELWARYWRVFVPMALAVVGPVDLLLYGVAAGELWSSADTSPPAALQALLILEPVVLTVPLVTAVHIRAVMAIGRGERPRAADALRAGWEDLPPVSWTVLLAMLGTVLGLIAFILPGLFLAVRWVCATQAVVVERRTGPEALRRSGDLVQAGGWWRTCGIVLLLGLVGAALSGLVSGPLIAAASLSDLGPVDVAAQIVGDTISLSFSALVTTMLFFDLRARAAARSPRAPAA